MLPASMLNLGNSWNDLKKKYNITFSGREDPFFVLLLSPLKKDVENQWRIKIFIDPDTFIPVKAIMEGDNISVITETQNRKLNPVIDEKIFNFKTPAGAQLMNMP